MTSFSEQVYALTSLIPQGKVTTYKLLAQALHCKAYRAVGQALSKNPYAPLVPCHRIVLSDGRLGGFAFGKGKKQFLLEQEGVFVKDERIVNFSQNLYSFELLKL